ncbi:MAG TPA: GNAT family N-acetyltransferase [Ignavibacteriaceae bacterium]|nr:GNAT family N-acetyltransferase [Ignavibacteriaceae bacterium]
MLEIKKIENEAELGKEISREKFIDFLFVHLDQFGDSKSAISKCIDFAFGKNGGLGGFLLVAYWDGELCGELIMNKTGMSEFIPENILVYIAVNSNFRNKGIGRQIAERGIKEAEGNVKLHVEYENPAKRLYERIGFTTKYAEMRYNKGK